MQLTLGLGNTNNFGSFVTHIVYPVLIVPNQHDENYKLSWSCQILVIFRSSIPWSSHSHTLTLACKIFVGSVVAAYLLTSIA